MIRPKLYPVKSGTILSTNLVNDIINRTEYAADLLRQYKLIAGTEMYVEPHYDGTRISYLQAVGGGVRPIPPESNVIPKPTNPTLLSCSDLESLSFQDLDGSPPCAKGPPCFGWPGPAICAGVKKSGYVISTNIWPNSCLLTLTPNMAYAVVFYNGGFFGTEVFNYNQCDGGSVGGQQTPKIAAYDSETFYMYVDYFAEVREEGGSVGISAGCIFRLI